MMCFEMGESNKTFKKKERKKERKERKKERKKSEQRKNRVSTTKENLEGQKK